MDEYPKWVPVDGPGNPQMPGYQLVASEDEERQALATGRGSAALNPPPDPGQKSLDDMSRDELIAILVAEGIPEDMSDDEIRNAIRHGRETRAQHAREDAEADEAAARAHEAGGDHNGDGLQTNVTILGDAAAAKDAEGNPISPDTADEANKVVASDPDRTAPAAKSAPASDNAPADKPTKVADDQPGNSTVDQSETPPDKPKGTSKAKG